MALNSAGRPDEALRALEAAQPRHPADRDILMALVSLNRDRGGDRQFRRVSLLYRCELGGTYVVLPPPSPSSVIFGTALYQLKGISKQKGHPIAFTILSILEKSYFNKPF